MNPFKAVVIGTSAGGLKALSILLSGLGADFPIPVIIVQHMSRDMENQTVRLLGRFTHLRVKEADDKEQPAGGSVYLAAPNYHLMIERNAALCLSVDPKVNYSRPSIDVLFETAAEAYGEGLIALVLTGANNDGSRGSLRVKEMGGHLIVQDPKSAASPTMPQSVIDICEVDKILSIEKIADYLKELTIQGEML